MPDWKKLLRKRLAKLCLAPEREAEVAEEFAQHAEDRYQELLASGLPEAEARRAVMHELAGRALTRELREVERTDVPDSVIGGSGLLCDVRYGFRSLRASLGLTLVVIAVLGLGIGANVAMFTVVDAAFLRPLRLPEPDRLVRLSESSPSSGGMPVAYPNFVDWEKQSRSFQSMGISAIFPHTLKRHGANERIQVAYVSAGFERTYGIPPLLGRAFTEADDRLGAQPSALLSHRFWKSHFGGDPGVVGRTLVIDDQVWTIAGVLPRFDWTDDPAVFVPIAFGLEKWGLNYREQHSNSGVIARLKPGVSLRQARAEMKLIAARLEKQYPGSNGGISAVVVPLREYIGSGLRDAALLMFGAVALLLLVACANVAGLLLARAAVRQREMAIRMALGATRAQLVRQLLTESLLLALGGAMLGVALAGAGLAALQQIFPDAERLGGIAIDVRVLAFSLLAAILTAVLFGVAPAVRFTRPGLADAIRTGGRGARGSALRLHTRSVLVVSQVALAVVLSIGAGLLLRSMLQAIATEPGFRPEHVVAAAVLPPNTNEADASANSRFLHDVSERLVAMPGVEAAGGIENLPFSNPDSWADFYRDDRPVPGPGKLPNAMKAVVTPGYFRTMGIPLLQGRLLSDADGRMPRVKREMQALITYLRSIELVAIINQTMARKFWPGEDPIGKGFRFGPPSLQGPHVRIVGVVGDARQFGLDVPVLPQYFFSAGQFPAFGARLVVRTTHGASGTAAMIRGLVTQMEPDAVVTSIEPMEVLVARSLTDRRNNLTLLALFSGTALLLAALGLYATMAYVIAQRTNEIGVRMALGAAASDVGRMVVREAAVLAGAGVVIGLVAALAGARVVASMLYGVAATDPLTYAGSAALLTAVLLAASYIPARRASRVDPLVALRCE